MPKIGCKYKLVVYSRQPRTKSTSQRRKRLQKSYLIRSLPPERHRTTTNSYSPFENSDSPQSWLERVRGKHKSGDILLGRSSRNCPRSFQIGQALCFSWGGTKVDEISSKTRSSRKPTCFSKSRNLQQKPISVVGPPWRLTQHRPISFFLASLRR